MVNDQQGDCQHLCPQPPGLQVVITVARDQGEAQDNAILESPGLAGEPFICFPASATDRRKETSLERPTYSAYTPAQLLVAKEDGIYIV